MPITFLESPEDFPDIDHADPSGIVAANGKLNPPFLLSAYRKGIFPWFDPGEPFIWWSPDPRMVLFPNEFKVSKSFRNILNRGSFEVKYNTCFDEAIHYCSSVPRHVQSGTWSTEDMKRAYQEMHKLGWAHSVEVWDNDQLVGGLYGIAMNNVYFGESMFSLVSNASKVALYSLCRQCEKRGIKLIDCQVYNNHLASLGAREIPRQEFKKYLPLETELKKVIL